MWRETKRNIPPWVRWKLKYVFLTKRTWHIYQKYCFGEHEKQLERKKQAQIFARSYSRQGFKRASLGVSSPPSLNTPVLMSPSASSILPRFVAQNPRPRNGDKCFPAAKARGKKRYLQQDHTQGTLSHRPRGGSRPIPIPIRHCARYQEPSVSHRMRPHGLLLGILPRGVMQMIQSHQQQ